MKKFYEKKLILDLSKQPHERKCIKAFFSVIKTWRRKKHDNREKKVHVTQHVGRLWRESKFVKLYAFGVHAISWYLFYFIYVVFAVCMEICVCLLCLIFVNSFIKTDDESWQLYRGTKKSRRIMNLWKGKKICRKNHFGALSEATT